MKEDDFESLPNSTDRFNVVELDTMTKLDLPPDRILEKAREHGLENAIVIGWSDKEGRLYFASSLASAADTLWLIEMARNELLDSDGE